MNSPAQPPRQRGNRFILVEDHLLVARAIARVLENLSGDEAVIVCATGAEALAVAPDTADMMIVDLGLPDMSGLSVVAEARKRGLAHRFLLMSGSPLDDEERDALAGACDGFIHKSAEEAEWIAAIQQGLAAPAQTPAELSGEDTLALLRAAELTERERAVLGHLARGASSEEIAAALSIALGTVRKHRENIRTKLGVRSLSAAIRVAVQVGL